ncbi:hypothetical protein JD844_004441 [Phrynosoma platyrhinos]|uniref:Lys-63-specific deubiquitinase BRCC36 n=1 Tax=Phrynosoma platyrhinos TaxID=52577 RepID=A0ABQ7TMG0_PHRPL|nr:hypothetical protein JD844_004441 [Phrynosoma platyrhinos]
MATEALLFYRVGATFDAKHVSPIARGRALTQPSHHKLIPYSVTNLAQRYRRNLRTLRSGPTRTLPGRPVGMAVQAAHLEADAFLVCLNHALSTEKEEVMGLCIGEVDTSRIVHIHSVIILRRSDKRKDRVEISPEQLSAASTEAEISFDGDHGLLDRPDSVYLFPVYSSPKEFRDGNIDMFPSSRYERIEIPIHVVPHNTIGKVCLESAVELPKILCQEEQDAYRKIHSLTHLDSITKIHNGSVFTKNLCSQMSAISGPLLQWLEDRLEQNKQRMLELQQEKEELLKELVALE